MLYVADTLFKPVANACQKQTSVKPQHVELLAKTAPEKTVRELIDEKAQLDNRDKIIALLGKFNLTH